MKALLVSLLPLVLVACSGGSSGGGGGGGGGGGTGTLEIQVTDAPFQHDIVAEARIAISEVRMHREADAESGFVTLYQGAPIDFDLLDLQDGVTLELVRADLPPGDYRQLRLILSGASLTLTNGNVYSTEAGTLQLTSTDTSGLKVFVDPPIQVVTDTSRGLLLDFDLTKTFHPIPANDPLNANRYQLHPVIRVANVSETGVLRGFVTTDDGTGQQVPVEDATVAILAPGESDPANAIATTGTRPNGHYTVLGLAPGTYDVLATKGELSGRADGQQVFAGNATDVDLVVE